MRPTQLATKMLASTLQFSNTTPETTPRAASGPNRYQQTHTPPTNQHHFHTPQGKPHAAVLRRRPANQSISTSRFTIPRAATIRTNAESDDNPTTLETPSVSPAADVMCSLERR